MQIDKLSTIEIADKVLMHFNDHEMTNMYFLFINAGFPESEIENGQHARTIINVLKALEDSLGYIEQTGDSGQWYLLTDLGRHVKKSGGHFAYLKKIEEKALVDTERQKLNDKKLKYDVKNAKRIFKTYWWTFGISILGFLLALGKIIYDILKAK